MKPHHPPRAKNRYCASLQKNLDICMNKQIGPQKCGYMKKVLDMCLKRKKKIVRMGP